LRWRHRRQTVRGTGIDVAAVRLELDTDSGRRKTLEDLPAMRHTERLAAAECDIGNLRLDDLLREIQGLIPRQLIGPASIGSRLLATREARRRTAVGQLPRDYEWRAVFVDLRARHPGALSTLLLKTASSEPDIGLRRDLLRDVFHARRFPVDLAIRFLRRGPLLLLSAVFL
jgi:hypothetical protein